MLKLLPGAGFNPGFASGALSVPKVAARVEGGLSLFINDPLYDRLNRPRRHISAHIARAPFCEAEDLQDRFVGQLAQVRRHRELDSLGVHLTGPFGRDVGWLGLWTDFEYSRLHAERSFRLMDLMTRIDAPLLIENADFYHHDRWLAARNLEFGNELCRKFGAAQILDLTHIHVCANNLGVPAWFLLGRIALETVDVVHLSGVVASPDGTLHDGHGRPVPDEVWDLARQVLPLLDGEVHVVLEHTDGSWCQNPDAYDQEWQRLERVIEEVLPAPAPDPHHKERYGLGYLANVVFPRMVPALAQALGPGDFRKLVFTWGKDYFERMKAGPKLFGTFGGPFSYWTKDEVSDVTADFKAFATAVAARSHDTAPN